jgi:hypothetical protein
MAGQVNITGTRVHERVDVPLEEAIARLEVSVDPCPTCRDQLDSFGIANHGPDHKGVRRVVHSQSGSFGADWDEAAVIEFLRAADRIIETPPGTIAHATGHLVAARGPNERGSVRWETFSARGAES